MTETYTKDPVLDQEMDPELLEADVESERGLFRFRVPPTLYPLRGHFDTFPLVPGVCQVQWVVDAIGRIVGVPVAVREIVSMKFHNFLRPGNLFSLALDQKNGMWRYRVYDGDVRYASGRMRVTEIGRGQ